MIGDTGSFYLRGSIVDQPGKTVYAGGGYRNADYVLTQDSGMTSYGTNLFYASPLFVNTAIGDYRLSVTKRGATVTASPGIDIVAEEPGGDQDIDGRLFDRDVDVVTNQDGVRDLGALEAQPIARIFADGFGDAIRMVD